VKNRFQSLLFRIGQLVPLRPGYEPRLTIKRLIPNPQSQEREPWEERGEEKGEVHMGYTPRIAKQAEEEEDPSSRL
jgi:hypothetical protein